MKENEKMSRRGFTIIEVSLVLAIAGLIFLMIFIALPALQRSRRDAERREDMMFLISELKKFQTNNRGALPSSTNNNAPVTYNEDTTTTNDWAGFYKNYLGKSFEDPDGGMYVLNIAPCGGASAVGAECNNNTSIGNATFPNSYTVNIVLQASCNGEKAVASNNPRKLAVIYKLEGGGIYCGNT
ncbi:type II secretion system protein [Candidatus Saccharibacteria bacterium]|nr:type II secretion system protein [Candidatus Saccharibacteria bacterium]